MNENDLSRHLIDYAVGVESTPDTAGIRRRMGRIDRNRRLRTVGAAGSMVAIVAFGFMALGGSGQPTSDLDVRGEIPSPVPADPDVIPGSVEQPEDAEEPSDRGPDIDAGDVGTPPSDPDPPTHLQASPTPNAAPAEASTTLPPTTAPPTTVPSTTAPPTTVPSTTAPPTTTVAAASFSASSLYGSCEEDPPYDEYSGTASPGATITITSPYSTTAQTVADGSGHWYLRVEFPTAPVNSPFVVSASDGTAGVDMSFVRVG